VNISYHKNGTKVQRRKIEEMNQLRLQYMYTWKCHKETPCVSILNKNVIFFIYKIREQKGGTRPAWVGGIGGRGKVVGKGPGRLNTVQILCIHTYVNIKMIPLEAIPGMGEGEDKRECWRGQMQV
jgi:hypothetical protein